jgi:hypothetical protein
VAGSASRCAAAGLDPAQYSAHGLRSGYLTEAAREGVSLPEAMQQSRRRSVQQASRYYNEAQIAGQGGAVGVKKTAHRRQWSCPSAVLMLYKYTKLLNKRGGLLVARAPSKAEADRTASLRRRSVVDTAKAAGLLSGENGRIAGRVRRPLIEAAKARSGIVSDTELLEYALARVALEDEFGRKLVARKGHVDSSLDLEF